MRQIARGETVSASLTVYPDVYDLVQKRREEIHDKYGRWVRQIDIASTAVLRGMDGIEDELRELRLIRKDKI